MNNYETPIFLQAFLKWVLLGPYDRSEQKKRMSKIDTLTSIIMQLVVQFVKTPKQTNYQSNNKGASTYNTIETPLNVSIGLYVYHSTRSKKLIKFLLDLNVSISYHKIIDIKKNIAANIIEKSKENDGVFVPSSLVNNEPALFAIDNTDLKIDIVDGKDQLHETAIAVYQQQLQNQTKVPIFQVLCLESQVNRILELI